VTEIFLPKIIKTCWSSSSYDR